MFIAWEEKLNADICKNEIKWVKLCFLLNKSNNPTGIKMSITINSFLFANPILPFSFKSSLNSRQWWFKSNANDTQRSKEHKLYYRWSEQHRGWGGVVASFAKRKHENEILVKIHDKGYVWAGGWMIWILSFAATLNGAVFLTLKLNQHPRQQQQPSSGAGNKKKATRTRTRLENLLVTLPRRDFTGMDTKNLS